MLTAVVSWVFVDDGADVAPNSSSLLASIKFGLVGLYAWFSSATQSVVSCGFLCACLGFMCDWSLSQGKYLFTSLSWCELVEKPSVLGIS